METKKKERSIEKEENKQKHRKEEEKQLGVVDNRLCSRLLQTSELRHARPPERSWRT